MRKISAVAIGLLVAGFVVQAKAQSNTQKMAVVFEGGFSEQQIKQRLDTAFSNYGWPHSEAEYGHIGSVLVKMRQMTGVREMDILTCTISARPTGMNIDLVDMISTCAAALERQ